MSEIPEDSGSAETAGASEKPDFDTFKPVGEPSASMPYLAPDLPLYFVPRTEFYAIKSLLLGRPTASLAPLTLHGPVGSGKTALAAALAHDADIINAFPDGVLWYSFSEDSDIQHAQSLWGKALGLDLSRVPDTTSRSAALRTDLRDKRALLIIDDVVDIEQVKSLNVGGRNCARVLTTGAEDDLTYSFKTRRYVITKMSEEEALAMLAEWAGILPDIYMPTVKEIIKRLAFHPLTLALVGGQARQGITWLRLLEVLRDDQGPIATLDTDDPDMRDNALGLIINLVLSRFGTRQHQRAVSLSALASGSGAAFSVDAAAACWDTTPEEAADALKSLVEASIVIRQPGGYFAIHQGLHHHLKNVARPGVVEEAADRVREFYFSLVENRNNTRKVDDQISQVMNVHRYIQEHDPVKASVFSDALLTYFEQRGLWPNLAALAEKIVQASREEEDIFREHTYLSDLGYAYTILGDLENAFKTFSRSLEISQKVGDHSGEAADLNNVGAILERQGEYLEAREYYERSLVIHEELGVEVDIAEALNNIAGVLYWEGRWDEALKAFQRALDMYNILQDRIGQARTWLNIGAVYEQLGHDEEAQQSYQRSLAIYTNENDEAGQAQSLNNLGIIYLNGGETDRALDQFKRSLALKEKLNDQLGEASTLNNIALLYEKTGSISLALDHYERSYHILYALEDPRADLVKENIDTLRKEMDRK